MHQIAPSEPCSASSSFAGLIASLAGHRGHSKPAWNDDGLADDIATISYEEALRTHSRHRTGSRESMMAPRPDTVPEPTRDGVVPGTGATAGPVAGMVPPSGGTLKTASITIRMSESECAQLRLRASEAGLTVSAYLRSCTLEVEGLRAQVKEALAQLRTPPGEASKPARTATAAGWWQRLWIFGRSANHGLKSVREN